MRGHELQAIVIARLEALTVDFSAHSGDRLRHDPDQTADEVRPERTFLLEQGQLEPSTTIVPGTLRTAMRLRAFYVDGPDVGKRIISDGERVLVMLPSISGNDHADIHGVAALGEWIPQQSRRVPAQIECTVDFIVSYRLTF